MLYADLILPLSLKDFYTYQIPSDMQEVMSIGHRVIVNFGEKKFYTAIVAKIHSNKPDFETKPIAQILDKKPLVNELVLKFWKWIAEYYMANIGTVYNAAIPSVLKLESQTKISFVEEVYVESFDFQFNEDELKLLNFAKNAKVFSVNDIEFLTKKSLHSSVNSLISKGYLEVNETVREKYQIKTINIVSLNEGLDYDEFLKLNKRAEKQIRIVNYLIEATNNEDSVNNILEQLNVQASSIKALEEKKIVTVYKKEISRFDDCNFNEAPKELNVEQLSAVESISNQFLDKTTVLLHGVTSSGKTEVYIDLIEQQIQKDKTVLYILPEIALTAQLVYRIKKVFGNKVCVYHSKLSVNQRAEIWRRLSNPEDNDIKVIIGVRAAIFLPFRNLGLIIIDEEHETTFKQYSAIPYYNARDCSVYLATLHGANVLMGTATPSVETYYNAISGKYWLVELKKRFNNFQLPEVIVVDKMRQRLRKEMTSFMTKPLYQSIEKALNNREQVILFQNRRGFAPYMVCNDCGSVVKCDFCDVSMVYHKYSNTLECHYCGNRKSNINTCPKCKGNNLSIQGLGTERIESEVQILFPEAAIGRLDLDSAKKKDSYELIIKNFQEHKIDILIGTQMISKGLDFENVTVVGIVDADSLLNFPDFRALERCYQLLVQVSGRCGRGSKKGTVILQTSNPEHETVKFIKNNSYKAMFGTQLQERKDFSYPPFVSMIKIVVKSKNQDYLNEFCGILYIELKTLLGEKLTVPYSPIIARVQNQYIKHFTIKLLKNNQLQSYKNSIYQITEKVKTLYKKDIQVCFDVDVV